MWLPMLGDIPVLTFANNFYNPWSLAVKRLIDIIGSLVGIVITLIVSIFVAPAILIESRGPLIFKQRRVGKNGRFFYVYKFRSMYKDAEERKKALMEQNEMKGLMFKMTDDPRITKVGKFIRKTSIDELPQFFNVFLSSHLFRNSSKERLLSIVDICKFTTLNILNLFQCKPELYSALICS